MIPHTRLTIRTLALHLCAVAGIVLSGCNVGKLFKADGSACLADTNCPNSQVCCNGSCAKSCGDAGGMAVSTTLATDWVPGYEFDSITVDLDGTQHQVSVNAVTELVNPRPISQFTGIAHGAHIMTVTLTLAGAPVAARIVDFSASSDIKVPFTLRRTCGGVSCAAPYDQCLGGACVSRDCSDLTPANCPSPTCVADSDCTAASTCSIGVCISGVCLSRRQDTMCAADQRCIPSTGCTVQHDECDVELECDDLACVYARAMHRSSLQLDSRRHPLRYDGMRPDLETS